MGVLISCVEVVFHNTEPTRRYALAHPPKTQRHHHRKIRDSPLQFHPFQLLLVLQINSSRFNRTTFRHQQLGSNTLPNFWRSWMTSRNRRATKGIHLGLNSPSVTNSPSVSLSPLGRKPSCSLRNCSRAGAYLSTASMAPFLSPSAAKSSPTFGLSWERISY
jgi:hypothetical protein